MFNISKESFKTSIHILILTFPSTFAFLLYFSICPFFRQALYCTNTYLDCFPSGSYLSKHSTSSFFILLQMNCGNILVFKHLLYFFTQALRICCQDMFFGRSRSSPTVNALTGARKGADNATLQNPLQNAFRHTKTTRHRLNVVEELFNIKVNQPLEKDISNEVSRIDKQQSKSICIFCLAYTYCILYLFFPYLGSTSDEYTRLSKCP